MAMSNGHIWKEGCGAICAHGWDPSTGPLPRLLTLMSVTMDQTRTTVDTIPVFTV